MAGTRRAEGERGGGRACALAVYWLAPRLVGVARRGAECQSARRLCLLSARKAIHGPPVGPPRAAEPAGTSDMRGQGRPKTLRERPKGSTRPAGLGGTGGPAAGYDLRKVRPVPSCFAESKREREML